MHAARAFTAGVLGGAAMTGMMTMARIFGMEGANLSMMLGTMLFEPGGFAWIVGFVMHLVISGLIALIYAWGFEHVTHRAGAAVGAGFGIIHATIGGIFMGMVPAMHPRMPGEMMPPGAFLSNLGMMGVVAIFLTHLVYGAVVGSIYAPVLRTRPMMGGRAVAR